MRAWPRRHGWDADLMGGFLAQLLNGLQYGLLLFLISSGLTLMFGVMGVINLAHGSLFMIGAYLAYAVAGATGFVLAGGAGGDPGRRGAGCAAGARVVPPLSRPPASGPGAADVRVDTAVRRSPFGACGQP